jgi:mitochondrial fission protein ELM1
MGIDDVQTAAGTDERSLTGARGWVITDGRAGMLVQARGVADALGLDIELKSVSPRGLYKLMAPYAPVDPAVRFGQPGSAFAPPWPRVAIGCGRASLAYIRALKRRAGAATFTVVVQDPRINPRIADLVCVPEHDRCRGPNVVVTLTAPHSYSAAHLAALRSDVPPDIAALSGPRVAVLLGGRNGSYEFTPADDARLARGLEALARLGVSFMISPSRRSHPGLLEVADAATRGRPRIVWSGIGDNPYPSFLAHADAFVVTADSVNMTGECCATGRPVYVFEPSGGAEKFKRFHASLRAYGATRLLPENIQSWQVWSYAPLDAAHVIAAEIERRWQRRAAMLSGLVADRPPGGPA